MWRYLLDTKFVYYHPLLRGITFRADFVTILHGRIHIEEGYAWDGCSPAVPLPFGYWIGTPDGKLCQDGRPQAFYASLVHDALCQNSKNVGISKDVASSIFSDMLRERGFSPFRAVLYKKAVMLFGPQSWGRA